MKLKREQYENDVYVSLQNIRDSVNHWKDKQTLGFNFNFQPLTFNDYVPTSTVLNTYQLKDIIQFEFRRKNIRQPFEFCIINEAMTPVMFSTGYKLENLDSEHNYKIYLSNNTLFNTEQLNIFIIQPENIFFNHLIVLLLFSIIFTAVIITAFFLTVRTMLSQKRLSEIKSDFINNMTHEFKTPIATIQLASDALNNIQVIQSPDQIKYYSGMIKEENQRMNLQVERILQAAQLEKNEIKLQLKKLDIHDLIYTVAEHTHLQMKEAGIKFETDFKAIDTQVMVDEVHFTNILFNLIDNAIKYRSQNPEIRIATQSTSNMLQVKIIDNGIGMDKDVQYHIFEKFFRAHTGNIHNVKGFGLGLSYVKSIIEAHHGKVQVQSELGKGSTFTLSIPIAKG